MCMRMYACMYVYMKCECMCMCMCTCDVRFVMCEVRCDVFCVMVSICTYKVVNYVIHKHVVYTTTTKLQKSKTDSKT